MTRTRYVIMANGKGVRWGEHLGIPKHLLAVDGVTLLDRIVRQTIALDSSAEIIISSSDHRSEVVGTWRHSPRRNGLEIDRFVPELVTDNTVFLYGDTYYSDDAIAEIVAHSGGSVHFYGDSERIVAVRVRDAESFLARVGMLRKQREDGLLTECRGWQVFRHAEGLDLEGAAPDAQTLEGSELFTLLTDWVWDFNTAQDLATFEQNRFLW